MSRLFIIGNGYDISRRNDTSYINFKKWLVNQYAKENNIFNSFFLKNKLDFNEFKNISSIPSIVIDSLCVTKNNEEQIKKQEMLDKNDCERHAFAAFILLKLMEKLGDNSWSNFENQMAKFPIKDLLCDVKNNNPSDSMLGSPVDKCTDLVTSIQSDIIFLFAKWISNLPLTKNIGAKPTNFEAKIIGEIKQNDFFLIFNYTTTLEDLVPITNTKNVCHIHGSRNEPCSIIVGHGDSSKCNGTGLSNTNDYINEFYSSLYKNTDFIIQKNNFFFEKISNLCKKETLEIYEYGWSCAEPDLNYIRKICDITTGVETCLHLHNFNNQGNQKMQNWINIGFPKDKIDFYVD